MTKMDINATKYDIEIIFQKINLVQDLLKNDNEFSLNIRMNPVKVLKDYELDVCLPISAEGELLSALLTRTAPVFYESTLDSVTLLLDEVAKGRRVILPNNFWGAWTNGAVSVEVVANVVVWTEAAIATLAVAALAVLGSGSDLKTSKTDESGESIPDSSVVTCHALKQYLEPEFKDFVVALAPEAGLSIERLITTIRSRASKGTTISYFTNDDTGQEVWIKSFSLKGHSYMVRYSVDTSSIVFETISSIN